MKTSQWRRVVKNRCVFSARLKALSDRSAVAGPIYMPRFIDISPAVSGAYGFENVNSTVTTRMTHGRTFYWFY